MHLLVEYVDRFSRDAFLFCTFILLTMMREDKATLRAKITPTDSNTITRQVVPDNLGCASELCKGEIICGKCCRITVMESDKMDTIQ